MKRLISALMTMALLVTLSACGTPEDEPIAVVVSEHSVEPEPEESETIEITEKMFTQQINYIYLNPKVYLGREIEYEGMYTETEGEQQTTQYVFRYGPGCCEYDENVGFEVVWTETPPAENDWVRVKGTLEYIYHDGAQFLAVYADEMEVMDKRGTERVT